MTTKKKNWIEKRDNPAPGVPKVFRIDAKMAGRWGTKPGDTCAIPHPKDVDEIMKKVPRGKLLTINEIRQKVAKKYKATIGCPITCGIFAWISANAADEEMAQKSAKGGSASGGKDITPYWRTLKSDGSVNEKYPGGTQIQKALLEKEGHKVIQKGKKFIVENYQQSLIKR